MKRPYLKLSIIGGLFFLATLLSGCGALRIAYNQAPDLSYWWLDGFVDFNSRQDPGVRNGIDAFFRWHRGSQLPTYAQLLARAQVEVQEPATAEQACRWYADLVGRLQPLVQYGLPLALDTVRSLTPQQLKHLERKYAKRNAEYAGDYLQTDPGERIDASVERALDRAEVLYGRLDAAQKQEVRRLVAASPFDPVIWLEERKARQQDILQTLRRLSTDRPGADETRAALQGLADRMLTSPRAPFREYEQRLRQYNCEFAAKLHNSTSRKQRQRAVETLRGWEEDFRVLGRGK